MEQTNAQNIDQDVVMGFGKEWQAFVQSTLCEKDRQDLFNDYFSIFPWDELLHQALGSDVGCGAGRWALLVAPCVGDFPFWCAVGFKKGAD